MHRHTKRDKEHFTAALIGMVARDFHPWICGLGGVLQRSCPHRRSRWMRSRANCGPWTRFSVSSRFRVRGAATANRCTDIHAGTMHASGCSDVAGRCMVCQLRAVQRVFGSFRQWKCLSGFKEIRVLRDEICAVSDSLWCSHFGAGKP
eukprot:6491617-Amphidinium_carterae.4